MKDIYSPLDIDEEWDDITPDMAGSVAVLDNPNTPAVTKLAVTSAEAPDLSGNDGTSTLAPVAEVPAEAPAEMPADMSNTNMAPELKEPIAEDAAYKVANTDMGMGMGMNTMAANTDDKLNINEINPGATAAPATEMAMPNTNTEVPKADAKVTTPIPVIDMNEAETTPAAESITMPGESFTPEEKPTTGDRFEGMETEEKEEAPKEEKPEALKEEPAAAELPVTHADKKATLGVAKDASDSGMKFDMGDTDKAMERFEKESDTQDNKFINMIKETQARALEGLNHEIEILQNTLDDQDKDLEERNAKRDMTQVDLNKLKDEKSKVEGYL